MDYPDDIDPESIALCDALNSLPGIRTCSSCCGHGKRSHRVFFTADNPQDVEPIRQAIEGRAWRIEQARRKGVDILYFMLQGPAGPPDMVGGADELAGRVLACMPI